MNFNFLTNSTFSYFNGLMEYYYVHKGKKKGPFSLTEIYKKDIKEDTLIWHSGLKDWIKAVDSEELKIMFKKEPPTISPPPIPESHLKNNEKDVPEIELIVGHLVLSYLFFLLLDKGAYRGAWPFINAFFYVQPFNFFFYIALILRIFQKSTLRRWIIVLIIQWLFLIYFLWNNNKVWDSIL